MKPDTQKAPSKRKAVDKKAPNLSWSALELLEALSSGAVIVNTQGQIDYVNPTLCLMLRLEESKLLGTLLADWVRLPEKTVSVHQSSGNHSSDYQSKSPLSSEVLIQAGTWRDGAGQELRVKFKNTSLPDGRILSLVDPFSEDATLTQAHADFVSTVSHEFRTPLTSIKGFADTILKYEGQFKPEEQRRFIHIIKDQADRLIRLVESLLVVSKLGAGRLEMSYCPVALAPLVDRITQSIQMKAGSPRQFNMNLPASLPSVWADADRLEQVLTNLIDNAVKYSEPPSPVHVSAIADNDWIEICIRDEGPGIPSEHLDKLFTKFYRIEGPLTQKVEGTGLGLYITRSLTMAMNGEIWAESMLGQGTTFHVRFPVATPERQAMYQRRLHSESE